MILAHEKHAARDRNRESALGFCYVNRWQRRPHIQNAAGWQRSGKDENTPLQLGCARCRTIHQVDEDRWIYHVFCSGF